eukprot:TRINITY_DN10258_c0_g1_i5.p1 TRINITY_DN10258_c0_g1~~TRINITY_DN10258_c0_g1_i5.p1  ORF type:complete len:237 (+),score=3.26 TRINITY_DN10258_c0_g1_i5:131-841(+)
MRWAHRYWEANKRVCHESVLDLMQDIETSCYYRLWRNTKRLFSHDVQAEPGAYCNPADPRPPRPYCRARGHSRAVPWVYLHEDDVDTFKQAPSLAKVSISHIGYSVDFISAVSQMLGMDLETLESSRIQLFDSAFKVNVGQITLQALHTPGHCPGHTCYLDSQHRVLFSGDLLFKESVGRTDLPGGDKARMKSSLATLLQRVPSDANCQVFPGHMEPTTMHHERSRNIFLKSFKAK